MPTLTIDEVKAKMRAALVEARDIAEKADQAGRDLTGDERKIITEKMGEAQSLKQQLDDKNQSAEVKAALEGLGDTIGLAEKGEKRRPSGLIEPKQGKSLGEHFTESEIWNNFVKRHNGHFGEKTRIQTDALGFKHLVKSRGVKTLVTGLSDTSAGAYVQNDWRGFTSGLELFQRPLTIRDVVTNGTTTSDTVEYARITGITNNAAPVAEATSSAMPTTGASSGAALTLNPGGGYKPESGFATERETAVVKTIAHWIPATKRALSDAAQVRTLIDNFLEYGLEEELEDQMISGSGSGENFEGIGTVTGVQAQAWDTDALVTTRKARTKVRTVGRARPNAYVFHPNDLEMLDLLMDNEARFYFGGPSGLGTAQALWGLPVIESEAIPQGTGYCGDFTKAILWDREQSSISVTDSHADFFVRNLVAILAEMRAAFGVTQPSAFVEIDMTA